jgi:hypothetical protein
VHRCARENEAVFGTGFVEVDEVHAHPPFSIGFLHQDYVDQPVGVVDLLDELCLEELLDLYSHGFDSLRCELSSLLFYRLHVRVHI